MRVSVNFGAPLVQHIATLPLGAGVTGLDIARATDHLRGSDFTVCLLRDMAIQAVQLGRPDEALRLAHLGYATATGTAPRVRSYHQLPGDHSGRSLRHSERRDRLRPRAAPGCRDDMDTKK